MKDIIFNDRGFYFLARGGEWSYHYNYENYCDINATAAPIKNLESLHVYPNYSHGGVRKERVYQVLKVYSSPKDRFYSVQC